MQIFLDMDGVITDFVQYFIDHYSIDPNPLPDEELWPKVHKIPGFWRTLPWMPDGKKLWDFVRQYEITILTSPSRSDERSKPEKLIWVRRELGEVPVIFARAGTKKDHLSVGDILIDDRLENLRDLPKDVHGILHTSADTTINELTRIIGSKNEGSTF